MAVPVDGRPAGMMRALNCICCAISPCSPRNCTSATRPNGWPSRSRRCPRASRRWRTNWACACSSAAASMWHCGPPAKPIWPRCAWCSNMSRAPARPPAAWPPGCAGGWTSALPAPWSTATCLASCAPLARGRRKVEGGLSTRGGGPEPLCSLPLAPAHFVCCLPEDHALAGTASVDLRALAAETFVMFSRAVAPANHDNVIPLFHPAGIHPRILHATRQWLTVLTLVALRMGVALVPACMAQAAVTGVRLLPIAKLRHPCVGVLAWHQDAVTPALRGFLDVAAAHRP